MRCTENRVKVDARAERNPKEVQMEDENVRKKPFYFFMVNDGKISSTQKTEGPIMAEQEDGVNTRQETEDRKVKVSPPNRNRRIT